MSVVNTKRAHSHSGTSISVSSSSWLSSTRAPSLETNIAVILPARYLLTMGHFIVTTMVFFTKEENIARGLPASATPGTEAFERAHRSMQIAWTLSMVCFSFDFLGLFAGYTMFVPNVNFLQIMSHFCGGILISWLISFQMHYVYLWYVFVLCHVPTALSEIAAILFVHYIKARPYR